MVDGIGNKSREEVLETLVEQQKGLVEDLKNVIRSINDLSTDVTSGLKSILIILVIIIIAILFEEIVRVCIYTRNKRRKKAMLKQKTVLDNVSSIASTTTLKNYDNNETRFKWNSKKNDNPPVNNKPGDDTENIEITQQPLKNKETKVDKRNSKNSKSSTTTSTLTVDRKENSNKDNKSLDSKSENAPKEVNFFAPPQPYTQSHSLTDTRVTLSSDPSIPPRMDNKNRFQYGSKQVVDSLLISQSPREEMYPSITSTTTSSLQDRNGKPNEFKENKK
uniref:Uncharacterized protein n=1 Tax=Parastrongyloides trichosuri TaxID=131310 RepID=A0A0N4ZNQ9_PARTI